MADLETLLADTRYFADQGSDPAAPSAGEPVLYTKSGQLYVRNSAAIVGPLLDETAHDALDHTGLPGVGGGSSTFVGVHAVKTASFPSLTSGAQTTLAFDGTDAADSDAFHDPASNNTRLTVPSGKAGYYQPWVLIGFASNASGRRSANLLLNGSASGQVMTHMAVNGASTIIMFMFPPMNLAVADYLEVQALQSSGGSLSTNAQQFGMYLLGT